jgi:hypothetical protein
VKWGALPLAGLCFAAAAAGTAEWNARSLFDALAKDRPARAAFHETKFMALLDRPLESSGELVFTPPDRLEKRTLLPKPERIVVDGDRVTLERAGKTHSLGLRENPAIAALVEGLRGTLAGDLAALTRTFSVGLDGSPERWRLILRPLDPGSATLVDRIEIGGAEKRVRSVTIFQSDGDRSVMTLSGAAP